MLKLKLIIYPTFLSGTSIALTMLLYIYVINTRSSLIYIQMLMCLNNEISPSTSAMSPHQVLIMQVADGLMQITS